MGIANPTETHSYISPEIGIGHVPLAPSAKRAYDGVVQILSRSPGLRAGLFVLKDHSKSYWGLRGLPPPWVLRLAASFRRVRPPLRQRRVSALRSEHPRRYGYRAVQRSWRVTGRCRAAPCNFHLRPEPGQTRLSGRTDRSGSPGHGHQTLRVKPPPYQRGKAKTSARC